MRKTEPSEGKARRGTRLSPEGIVDAAIRLADDEGLDAVSIRRVAAELDARAMSLYDHFASKDELLASMTDEVVGEMLVSRPLPEAWREAVVVSAQKMYEAFTAHPWLISAFSKQPSPGPNAIEIAKQNARAVASLPLDRGDVWNVQGIVNDYVVGYLFRMVAASANPDAIEVAVAGDAVELPELSALPDNLRSRSSIERFDLGLQTVLDGIEQRFALSSPAGGR